MPDAHEQTKGERENARHGRFLQIGRKTVYLHRQYPACDRQPVRPGTKPTDKTGRNAQAGPEQHTDDAQHHCDTSRDVIRAAFQDIEESDHTEHLLVERLRQSDAYIAELSLVAETADGQIAGHIMLSKAEVISGDRAHTVLAVAPLSVLPAFQKSGIGSMLIREAHRRASDSGYDAAVLLGHKDYYPKFGYKKASLSGIKFPFDAPDECCMVAELKPGALKDIHGTVHYPDAFQIDAQ